MAVLQSLNVKLSFACIIVILENLVHLLVDVMLPFPFERQYVNPFYYEISGKDAQT